MISLCLICYICTLGGNRLEEEGYATVLKVLPLFVHYSHKEDSSRYIFLFVLYSSLLLYYSYWNIMLHVSIIIVAVITPVLFDIENCTLALCKLCLFCKLKVEDHIEWFLGTFVWLVTWVWILSFWVKRLVSHGKQESCSLDFKE